jgi:GDPmannose 4,6-dehydratase
MNKSRVALITGITGQDGSYLADFLLEKEYKVFGLERRSSQKNRKNIEHILDKIELISGDLLDEASLVHAIKQCQPDEVYNLAAQSFVAESWKQPVYTSEVTGLGVLRLLEAIRQVKSDIRFYQASSSEMFGQVQETPQTEKTPFYPRSPYGVAKLFGYWTTVNYRESYNIFAANGILFNHESPRRGLEFVTQKIVDAAVKIRTGQATELRLGNLEAKRDWGFAGDYVQAMWKILQQDNPDDFVIGTGETHTVKEFVEKVFDYLGLDYKKYVIIDKEFFRPADVNLLMANPAKAEKELGWKAQVGFDELIEKMIEAKFNKGVSFSRNTSIEDSN